MSKFANMKIGKKLTILLATGIGSVIAIGGFSWWALGAIRGTAEQQQIESDKMMSAARGERLGSGERYHRPHHPEPALRNLSRNSHRRRSSQSGSPGA